MQFGLTSTLVPSGFSPSFKKGAFGAALDPDSQLIVAAALAQTSLTLIGASDHDKPVLNVKDYDGTQLLQVDATGRLGVKMVPDADLSVLGSAHITGDLTLEGSLDLTGELVGGTLHPNALGVGVPNVAKATIGGTTFVTNETTVSSGEGLALSYNAASHRGRIRAYDFTGLAYKGLDLDGLDLALRSGGVRKLGVNQNGVYIGDGLAGTTFAFDVAVGARFQGDVEVLGNLSSGGGSLTLGAATVASLTVTGQTTLGGRATTSSVFVTGRDQPTTGDGLEIYFDTTYHQANLIGYNRSTSTYRDIVYQALAHKFNHGPVIIGTATTTSYFLDVSGPVHFASDLTVDGTVHLTGGVVLSGTTAYDSLQITNTLGVGVAPPTDVRADFLSKSQQGIRIRAGQGYDVTGWSQILLSWNDTVNYSHAIQSRHRSNGTDNAIDFFLWDQTSQAATDTGNLHVLSLFATGGGRVGVRTKNPAYPLDVVGAANFSTTLAAGGTISAPDTSFAAFHAGTGVFSSTLTAGATTLASLGVTGAATIGTTLGVTGLSTLAGLSAQASTLLSLGVTNNATVGGTFGVTGATTLSDTLHGVGAVTLDSTLYAAGKVTVENALEQLRLAYQLSSNKYATFTVDSSGHLTINALGGVISPDASNSVRTPDFTSGLRGWGIDGNGNAEFNDLTARGSFYASIFKVGEIFATAGTQGVFYSAAKLAQADTTPSALGSTFTLDTQVDDTTGLGLLGNGDIVRIKTWTGNGISDVWATISSTATISGAVASYLATLQHGSLNKTLPAGAAVVDYGPSGKGFITLSADDTVGHSPNLTMAYHDGTPWNGFYTIARLGNLKDSYGYSADVFGMGIGQYGVSGQNWILVDLANGLQIGQNTTTFTTLDTAGNLRVGQSALGNVYISAAGTLSVNAGATAISTFYSSAQSNGTYATFNRPIWFATTGGFLLGGGSFASPTAGWKLSMPSSTTGKLEGFNGSGTSQVLLDTDGKIKAGGGTITLDAVGLTVSGAGFIGFYDTLNAHTTGLLQGSGGTAELRANPDYGFSVGEVSLSVFGSSSGKQLLFNLLADTPSGHAYGSIYTASLTFDGLTIGASGTPSYLLDVRGSFGASGTGYFGGTLHTVGAATFDNTLTSGAVNASGNSQFVNVLVTGDLTVNGSLVYATTTSGTNLVLSGYLDAATAIATSGTFATRLRAGDGATGAAGTSQLIFSWNGGTNYQHSLRSRHDSTAIATNAIDFYLWLQGTNAAGTLGTLRAMTLTAASGGSLGIGQSAPAYNLDVTGTGRFTGALTALTLNGLTVSSGTVTGGTWQGTPITDAYVADALTISGGTINSSTVGATTPSTGAFTTLSASGLLTASANILATSTIPEIQVLRTGSTQKGRISNWLQNKFQLSTNVSYDGSGWNLDATGSPGGYLEMYDDHIDFYTLTAGTGHRSLVSTAGLSVNGLILGSNGSPTSGYIADFRGNLYLGGRLISFGQSNAAAPTFTTRSAGTKLVLYEELASNAVDYALGIEGNTLWFSVPNNNARFFKWYGGTSLAMQLTSAGVISTATWQGVAILDAYVDNDLTLNSTKRITSLLTTEQLRASYDASNYWALTVGSTGDATMALKGVGSTLTLTGILTASSIQATPIGSVTASTGAFTTLSASGLATLASLLVTGNATINGILTTAGILAYGDILPDQDLTRNLGSATDRWLSLNVGELDAGLLVSREKIITQGGRLLVGESTILSVDLPARSLGGVASSAVRTQLGVANSPLGRFYLGGNLPSPAVGRLGMPLSMPGRLRLAGELIAPLITDTITTKHNNFQIGDVLYMESSPGGLPQFEYMRVLSGPLGTGPYTYGVVRNADNVASAARQWEAGDTIMDTGQAGTGWIDEYSIRAMATSTAASQLLGPTIAFNVRNSSFATDFSTFAAIGNLRGLYGISQSTNILGAGFGKYANGNAFITIDPTNGFRILNRASNVDTVLFQADVAGNLSLAGNLTLSTNGALSAGQTAYNTGIGYWLEYHGGTPRLSIGNSAANRLTWDGSTLGVVGAITLTSGNIIGSVEVGTAGALYSGQTAYNTGTGYWLEYNGGTPRMSLGSSAAGFTWDGTTFTVNGTFNLTGAGTIGTSGGLYQGSGSFGSPTTGLKLWNVSGVGKIAGYNAGTVQWYGDTDGKLYAGAGNVWLDGMGINLKGTGTYLSFWNAGASGRTGFLTFDPAGGTSDTNTIEFGSNYNKTNDTVPYNTGRLFFRAFGHQTTSEMDFALFHDATDAWASLFANTSDTYRGLIIGGASLTTKPTSGYLLDVVGKIRAVGTIDVVSGNHVTVDAGDFQAKAAGVVRFYKSDNTRWGALQYDSTNNQLGLFSSQGGGIIGAWNETTGAYTALSDRRQKTIVESDVDVLPMVLALPLPARFTMNRDPQRRPHLGYLAQDVYAATGGEGGEETMVADRTLAVLALGGVQRLLALIDELTERVRRLESRAAPQ